jgi:hypothetical protein
MADSNPVTSTLGTLQSAYGTLKGIANLNEVHVIKAQIGELQAQILAAQESALRAQERESALARRVDELKAKIAEFETWDREKERYELQRLPPGALVYGLKDAASATAPPHYLCANCFEQRKKSYLQSQGPSVGVEYFHCHTCGEKIRSGTPQRPIVQRTRRDVI